MRWLFPVMALCALLSTAASAQSRLVLPLNQGWRAQMVGTPDGKPGATWIQVDLPQTFHSTGYRSAWYEKTFKAPPLPAGWHALIHFGGVKYNSHVWLNDKPVGGHFGGYDAFDVDVTKALRPGESNLLRVSCHDRSGIFSPGPRVKIPKDYRAARTAPKNRELAPVGGRFADFGLWDRVSLRYVPPVRVSHTSIRTLVRDHRLDVIVEVTNDLSASADVGVAGRVLDRDGKQVLTFREAHLRASTGKIATVTLSAPAHLHLWSPADPYLHRLELTLTLGGRTLDRYTERFGYRQLWCKGSQFYLNGVPVVLRSSAAWPTSFRTRDQIANFWRQVKGANVFAFRTHTQPWPELYYTVADEVGILLIPEGAIWNDDCAYRIDDPVFWKNYRIHITSMIRTLGNHPSVVMFSLENEMYGSCLNEKNRYATRQLADLVHYAHKIAPVQLITLESDGDPLHSVDVVGIHYPHELPTAYAYPDTAYWMDKPIKHRNMYTNRPDHTFLWDHKKPLYIGEYLWCPDNTPGDGTVFFGDKSYSDPLHYYLLAKAEAWRLQTQAYRYYRVSGMSPWTMVEGGHLDDSNPLYVAERDVMRPITVFPIEFNTRFFGGRTVTRHVRVFNDSFAPVTVAFAWQFAGAGGGIASGGKSLSLKPCTFREVELAFKTPAVSHKTGAKLTLSLKRGPDSIFQRSIDCSVWPEIPLPPPPPHAVLFDPAGTTAKVLGPGWRTIPTLSAIPADATAVLVGDKAFGPPPEGIPVIGSKATGAAALSAFLARGGTVMVLAQENYPTGIFPTTLTDRHSTMCFGTIPDHPLLAGIASSDLRWWAGKGEHGVAIHEPQRPVGGTAVVVSGSKTGLATAPLIVYPAGKGTLVLCQLRLVEKQAEEPAARQLLANCIRYLNRPPAPRRWLRVLSAPGPVAGILARTRVATVAGPSDPAREILFCSGALSSQQRNVAEQALAAGAVLYLHRPDADTVAGLLPASAHLSLRPAVGSVHRFSTSLLAEHLLREDIYWLDLHHSYRPLPRANDMIAGALSSVLDRAKATVIPAAKLQISGHIVEHRKNMVVCATVGEGATEFDFGKGGWFLIGGSLGGTPAAKQFPTAQVRIDNTAQGSVSLTTGEFRDYAVPVHVAPGRHRVALAFINDANIDGQDRNMYIRDLMIQPAPDHSGVDMITTPAAVCEFPCRKGKVLVDCLRWDDSPHAGGRGTRALADLLTGLGATFTVESASIVPGTRMTITPKRQWNSVRNDELYLGTTGGAETKIRIARAGRYAVDIVGWGTAMENVYPIIQVSLGGKAIGHAELRSSSFEPHSVGTVNLAAGETTLRLEFVNDKSGGGEDRNAHIARVEFTRVADGKAP